jgi:queuine tRNA-ribosyltransferase
MSAIRQYGHCLFSKDKMFVFETLKQSKKSLARVGELVTPHGTIRTPAFIPVATLGVVKAGLGPQDLTETRAQCQITNTFHFLDLNRVGQVEKMGGLHDFFNFNKPIFTDSGGFQIFSLGKGKEYGLGKINSIFLESGNRAKKKNDNLLEINHRGAIFRSPRDGRKILLTPEISYETQKRLGADFVYLLDICGTTLDDHATAEKEMNLSHEWFERFLAAYRKDNNDNQRVFAIVQGGTYKDLRHKSVDFVNNLDVFGIAIGGALGKNKKEMYKTISWVQEKADPLRPRHLLGIGDLDVLEKIVKLGIDLFDCALPTRVARHGQALTSRGGVNLKSGRYKDVFRSIEKECQCPTCQNYTIAQINFLFRAKEQLAGKLLTVHNLFFLESQLEKIREKIMIDQF